MRTNLKNARKNKGLTQAQISRLSNISERQYRRIESGEQTPSVDVALLIAQALDIDNVKEIFPLQQNNTKKT